MAKLVGTVPENFRMKDGEDHEQHLARTSGLMEDYEKRSAKVDPGGTTLVGALLHFPVAGGHACYVVVADEPLSLKHIPYADGYEAAAATIRGVNKTTVKEQLRMKAFIRGQQNLNESFYASLKPGQIVHHYHPGGGFIRCEVVTGLEKPGLKPIALVGTWHENDLPRRLPDVKIYRGPYAEQVLAGEIMRPHESHIWESPRSLLPKMKNPADLSPVSLDVPEMTPEQKQQAAFWRKIGEIRALIDGDGSAPFILSEISRIVDPEDVHSCRRDGCAGPVCDRDVPNITRDDG